MFGLETMFSPYDMISVIAVEIEKQVGFPINNFVMILAGKSDTIEFKLNDETGRRPLKEAALQDALMTHLNSLIPENDGKKWTIQYGLYYWYKDNSAKKSGIDLHLINEAGEKTNITTKF